MPTAAPEIRLGPFDLFELVGCGGMADVWRGVHAEQGLPVAVKLITSEHAREPQYLAAFREEVRAMASMDHPGIVAVHDYGAVDREAVRRSGRSLDEGSPYIVMELASGGSIDPLVSELLAPPPWNEQREVLLAVLDALAHAHARGLVHRDLKPGNVLLCTDRDPRPGLKLTDFGIAHRIAEVNETVGEGALQGTPYYMAPEQTEDRWRDYGPWTDLYSLGCLAFELASGQPPVEGDSPLSLVLAHAQGRLRPFEPRIPVPTDLVQWLDRLLAHEPRARFQRAADAARALLDLEAAGPELGAGPSALPEAAGPEAGRPDDDSPTLPLAAGGRLLADLAARRAVAVGDDTPTVRVPDGVRRIAEAVEPTLVTLAPLAETRRHRALDPGGRVPDSWRRQGPDSAPARVWGAGLGLFGLREIPLVDRHAECDQLWQTLRGAEVCGEPRAVVLTGALGCGKSRLAEWLCQRGHETGGAEVMHAVHSPGGGPGEGIGPMLARFLRCHALPRERVLERLEAEWLGRGWEDEREWAVVAELVAPPLARETGTHARRVRLEGPEERRAVASQVVERFGAARTVVIWLDDVQWGADSLEFAQHLLTAAVRGTCPAVVVATVQREPLAERPLEAALLDRLLAHPAVEELQVGPLPSRHWSELVRGHLGLDGELAATVEQRAAGNPLFAIQLVGDWVHRGLLIPGGRGFSLRTEAQAEVPEDLRGVWRQRVEQLLERRPPEWGAALEAAAVLGVEVDGREWRTTCAAAGWIPPLGLLEELVEQRLVGPGDQGLEAGWRFTHGLLRESLLQRAEEAGRLPAHHRACADALREHDEPRIRERRARHLLGGDAFEEALEPLLLAADERRLQGDHDVAIGLLDERERALTTLSLPAADPRWGEGWVLRAQVHFRQGNIDASAEWAERADRGAREHDWSDVTGRALAHLGNVAHHRAELVEAWGLLGRAAAWARDRGDEALLATCLIDMARVLRDQGALEQAEEQYLAAREIGERLQDADATATCLKGLSEIAKQRGDLEAAVTYLGQARVCWEEAGARACVGYCFNGLGDLHRLRGDLHRAEEAYRQALALLRRTGAGIVAVVNINLGLVLLERSRYGQARELFEERLSAASAEGWRWLEGALRVFLLPCVAALEDWPAWDGHLSAAQELLADSGFTDVDLARAATRAGELATLLEQTDRAAAAWRLALAQWRGLERSEEAELVREALEALGG